MSRNPCRSAFAVAMALCLGACSSSAPPEAAGTAPDADADAAASGDGAPANLCQLLTVADVAAILKANGADTVTDARPGEDGGCTYTHEPRPGDLATRVVVALEPTASVAAARSALATRESAVSDRGIAPTGIPGLGDEGFAAETELVEGIAFRTGRYRGQVDLQVEGRDPVSLRGAAVAIARQLASRRPKD